MTYIITIVRWDDGVEIGPQHVRSSWQAAVDCAVKTAILATVFTDGLTTAKKRAAVREAKEEMRSSLEEGCSYQDLDNDWTIFISKPDSEE